MNHGQYIRELEQRIIRLISERDEALERQRELEKEKQSIEKENLEIKKKLLRFKKDLEQRGTKADNPEAWECGKVVEHIDNCWNELVSMVWVENPDEPGKVIVGRSENNIEEEKFKDMKSDRRRTTGKKNVVADINYYGPYLAYQLPLRNEEYIWLLYGRLEDMATRFSQVDPERFRKELAKFNAEKKGPQRICIKEEEMTARFDGQIEEIDRKLDEERYLKAHY